MADPMPFTPHFGSGEAEFSANFVWSGSLWVPMLGLSTGAVVTSAAGAGAGGIAGVSSSAIEGSHIFKASGGTLYSVSVVIGATSGWLMLFDSATDPADGAVTPLRAWPVASDGISGFLDWHSGTPFTLANGCVLAFSTTGPLTKTENASAVFSAQVQ